jgi:hypothetical protein
MEKVKLVGLEWARWQQDSKTQEFLDLVRASQADLKEAWASNNFTTPAMEAQARGAVQNLAMIEDIIVSIRSEPENVQEVYVEPEELLSPGVEFGQQSVGDSSNG